MRGINTAVLGLLSVACALLVSCGAPPPPPPPTIAEIAVTSTADANPDSTGKGAPVLVRVYQLSSTSAFDKADFFQLYEHEAETLGADLVGRDELLVTPGATQQLHKELKPGVGFIGVLVAFRDIQNATWRATAAPPPNQTTLVQVTVQGLAVNVAMAPAPAGP
jgi:type VI secretion system protein VasD